jgi:hypothetical protein
VTERAPRERRVHVLSKQGLRGAEIQSPDDGRKLPEQMSWPVLTGRAPQKLGGAAIHGATGMSRRFSRGPR